MCFVLLENCLFPRLKLRTKVFCVIRNCLFPWLKLRTSVFCVMRNCFPLPPPPPPPPTPFSLFLWFCGKMSLLPHPHHPVTRSRLDWTCPVPFGLLTHTGVEVMLRLDTVELCRVYHSVIVLFFGQLFLFSFLFLFQATLNVHSAP